MEIILGSETSTHLNQTPGLYPKENTLHQQHGESLKTKMHQFYFTRRTFSRICTSLISSSAFSSFSFMNAARPASILRLFMRDLCRSVNSITDCRVKSYLLVVTWTSSRPQEPLSLVMNSNISHINVVWNVNTVFSRVICALFFFYIGRWKIGVCKICGFFLWRSWSGFYSSIIENTVHFVSILLSFCNIILIYQ
jgi:hypothetical protein